MVDGRYKGPDYRVARYLGESVIDTNGCWVYDMGSYNRPNYRLVYVCLVGPIPAGLHIDHLCGNNWCINPAHMEAVTPSENRRRAVTRPNFYPEVGNK